MAIKDDDELQFYLQYDPEMQNITLMISSPSPITPAEYLLCLMDFVESAEKDVDELFEGGDDFLVGKH